MQRKSPSSHLQDTLEQFQLDQADQAVVDLAFEEAVESMIACACHQAVIAEPTSGTQSSQLTSSESATVPSTTVAVPNCTTLSLEQLSHTEPQVSPTSTVTTNSIASATTTPPASNINKCVPITGFLAEVFAPEVVAQVNQACQQLARQQVTHSSVVPSTQNTSNKVQQKHDTTYCSCTTSDRDCNGSCTPCEEVTMDQLQFEQNSISGNQALYHTTATTSNIAGDEDPVFSYHLYNRSYTHHPCEHDLQTYDPSNDKIEITICKDRHHGISISDETSITDLELECYELDFANEQELLECIYQDSHDFFNELQLNQLLLETYTPTCAITTATTSTSETPTHLATDSAPKPTTSTTRDNHKANQ